MLALTLFGCADQTTQPMPIGDPQLGGSSLVGRELTVDPGEWDGAPALTLQWLRDGQEIAGATGDVYVPVPADDRSSLACAVSAGALRVVTDPVTITYAAPVVATSPRVLDTTHGAQTFDLGSGFTGEDLTFVVDGAGASIDPRSGLVTIPEAPVATTGVTITAMNSGGEASLEFPIVVAGSASTEPAPVAVPAVRAVSTRAQLLTAIASSVDGDVIQIGPGVYDRFAWPRNTSHHLTLRPAQRNNPPILRGISIAPNAGDYFPAQSQKGSWAKNLTFDGLRFQAEALTRIQTRQNSSARVNIADSHGRGWGWRADFTYPGVTNLGESAGFVGLKIGAGSTDIVVKNCLFEGFAKAINTGGAQRLTVENNEFSEIAEDGVIIWGGTDLTFAYNLWHASRGISLEAAHAYGWKDANIPPHQDFFQIACNSASQYVTRLTIRSNVMYDDTVRVHGVLLNNAYVGDSTSARLEASRHRDVVVDNNFFDQTHTTGIQLTNVVGLTARHNKVMRSREVAGSNKNDVAFIAGGWGASTGKNMANIRVQDNVSRKFKGPWQDAWIWTGNETSNNIGDLPPGWVEMRPGVATAGHRKAGRYGQP
ncbi:MAG: right-handed parallel beta-helix repeat-containing protein [Kofleriaceae bacterium]